MLRKCAGQVGIVMQSCGRMAPMLRFSQPKIRVGKEYVKWNF
jgi:hypothetical protein